MVMMMMMIIIIIIIDMVCEKPMDWIGK